MKKFELGVYIKQNGNLVTVEEETDSDQPNFKYMVMDGSRCNWGMYMIQKPTERPYKVIGSSSLELGWGPGAFMNACEFLGEL